jgi:TRAP-type C4-dicarboxylate transport system substrate-binding protein
MVMQQAGGATLVSKKVFDTLSAEDQKALLEESATLEKKVLEQVRGDNAKALEAMKKQGLQVVATPVELERDLRKRGESIAVSEGKQFSAEFQAKVKSLIDQYRKN